MRGKLRREIVEEEESNKEGQTSVPVEDEFDVTARDGKHYAVMRRMCQSRRHLNVRKGHVRKEHK